uniref:Uncharacterized protein n=1 Tax=Anguilla anguilla TaxID=7936 RepID=A0A0E9VHB1_ANGAN
MKLLQAPLKAFLPLMQQQEKSRVPFNERSPSERINASSNTSFTIYYHCILSFDI